MNSSRLLSTFDLQYVLVLRDHKHKMFVTGPIVNLQALWETPNFIALPNATPKTL